MEKERIEAKIFVPVVRPFSEEELAEMPADEVGIIKFDNTQKVVREDHIATIQTDNRQELKSEVLDLYTKYRPNPILIRLNTTLGRTFLVDTICNRENDESILEDVYFTYNKKGKEIREIIKSRLASSREDFETALARIGWNLDDYVRAITGGKSYNELPESQEIEDNLRLLDSRERSIVRQIVHSHKNTIPNLYAEIAEKFGISKQFRKEEGFYRDFEPYTAVSRAIKLRQQPLDLNTVLLDFVEERGRTITRNGWRMVVDIVRWLNEFHPDMMTKDVIDTNNDTSEGFEVAEQSST